jgi:purine-binding chemotaxis protein CheW
MKTPGGNDAASRAPSGSDVELLRRRAAALARPPQAGRESETGQFLVFVLSGERYAIASHHVVQVAVLLELTPLPGASAPLFGITHWRGDVLTLLDLRAALGAHGSGVTDLSRIVVVDGPDRRFGIVVDAVVEMADIAEGDVRPLPDGEGGSSLLRGMTDDGLLIMDGEALVGRYGIKRGRHTSGRGG